MPADLKKSSLGDAPKPVRNNLLVICPILISEKDHLFEI